MTILKAFALAALTAAPATLATAHEYKAGTILVDHPYSFATPPGAATAAGYMTLTNNGKEDDRLIAARSAFSKTLLHESKKVDGVITMRHQHDGVPIPASDTVVFEPGGLHVMFIGLEERLKEGDEAAVTLVFEKAGEIDVTFNVEKRKTAESDDHSAHDDHGKKKKHSGHDH